MQRPISKDYYYIDFHSTIDSIKYRIYRITQKVKDMYKPSEEKKDYFCPRCSARWTQLEVLDNVGPLGFICHRCNGVLERDEESAGDKGGHEKQSRLMSQLAGMLKLLQQIDSEIIPNNDFDTAFSYAVPVQRNHFVNPVRPTVPVESGRAAPSSVKGLTQNTTPQLAPTPPPPRPRAPPPPARRNPPPTRGPKRSAKPPSPPRTSYRSGTPTRRSQAKAPPLAQRKPRSRATETPTAPHRPSP